MISGVEFVFLFWFFNEKEQAVPLQLFLLSVVLAVLAFGIEHFFNQFQEEHLKAGRLYFTHDPNGRVIQITRDKYAANVLPENLKIVGDNPFDLGSFIVNAIEAGFAEECIQPAYRLRMIDPNLENSTLLLAHVLSLNNRLGEAQKVLEGYLKNVGVSVEVLFKLAWVYSQNGDLEKFEDASWRGLNLDPNHKHGYELLSS